MPPVNTTVAAGPVLKLSRGPMIAGAMLTSTGVPSDVVVAVAESSFCVSSVVLTTTADNVAVPSPLSTARVL